MPLYLSDNWRFDVRTAIVNEIDPIIALGDRFVAAGWTIVASSNTSSIDASTRNDVTRWNNIDAWEHWRDPAGGRDITIQRGTTNRSIRMYLGQVGDAFSGGTLTAPPTGAETAAQLVGDLGNFNTSFLPSTSSAYDLHVAASQVGGGQTGDVYEFYLVITLNSNGVLHGGVALFGVNTPAVGDGGVPDPEPWVVISSVTWTGGLCWYRAGQSNARIDTGVTMSQTLYGFTTGTQVNPYTGEYDIPPWFVYSTTQGAEQRKGYVTNAAYFTTSTPAALDTVNNAIEGRSLIRFGNYLFPWPHGVTWGTDYSGAFRYGSTDWPFVSVGGWDMAAEPEDGAALELALPTELSPVPGAEIRNRVWDTVAGGWHVWITTNGADPTGLQYDGPGTYGVHTSNYSVI